MDNITDMNNKLQQLEEWVNKLHQLEDLLKVHD